MENNTVKEYIGNQVAKKFTVYGKKAKNKKYSKVSKNFLKLNQTPDIDQPKLNFKIYESVYAKSTTDIKFP